ncbi:MAG: hypothetical protein L6R39_007308 [Caloplaca ligustica]|nr:MAG: hypothetical protein L6R39_007308 [Caloplaca ligustica]
MARRVPLQDPEAAIRCLKADGGVILTKFSSIEDVARVNNDAAPFINKIVGERSAKSLPRETTRCTRLFGRSETARETWLQQTALLEVINHFLRTISFSYNDAGSAKITTDAILSAAATLDIGPGVEAQSLHRDEFIWQQTQRNEEAREVYAMGQDVSMGLLVPGIDTSLANGATVVSLLSPVPGGIEIAERDGAMS